MTNALIDCFAIPPFTEEEEVTKRSIRVQCWKKIQNEKIATNNRNIFNRITNFVDAEKAAQLLSETPEFKNAREYNWSTIEY